MKKLDLNLLRLLVALDQTRHLGRAAEALHLMNDPMRPITALFVVDGQQRPLGILHIHDLLRAGAA